MRSQPDPETPIPTVVKIDIASLDEATQMSIATARSLEDFQEDPDTRIEPESHKERPEVEKKELKELMASEPSSSSPKPKIDHIVHVTLKKVVTKLVDNNTNDFMKNNLPKAVAEAIRLEREKVKADIAVMIDDAVNKERGSIRAEFLCSSSIPDLQHELYLKMKDEEQEHDAIYLSGYRHYDDARPEEESSARRQKTLKHGMYIAGESSSSQAMDKSTPSGSGTQEQLEDFDAWQDDQGIDDDEAQQAHIKRQLKTRDDPEVVYSEKKIVDVIRDLSNQSYRLEYMADIVVVRADGRYSELAETEYKCLQKNDTKDMYLMCINEKIKDY
ncbi:hypothetical protein Tco_0835338 [Tanacetum coccineum]